MSGTKLGFIALCSVIAGLVVYGLVVNRTHQRELAELRNQLAIKDKTIEVQKGVYEKLTLETTELKGLLDTSRKEVVSLEKQLKTANELWLTMGRLAVYWKKAYEAAIEGTQTEQPPLEEGGPVRKKVEFDHDFGYIGVKGWTLTDPPQAFVNIHQNRPLEMTLVVSQDKGGKWHTRATSSEENVGIDIKVAAVNPYALSPKWYESIELKADFGVGDGVLMGLGASYRVGHFDVGPSLWIAGDDSVSKFYGANVSWRPFQRD